MTTEKRDFNAAAATWDADEKRRRMAAKIAETVRRVAPVGPHVSAVDLGAGTGLFTLEMAPYLGAITALDGSEGMLSVLRSKLSELGLTQVQTCLQDLDSPDPIPGPVDLALSSMVMHHVADIPAFLARVHACLKPGGFLAMADLYAEDGAFHDDNTGVFHFGFEPSVLQAWLEAAGFTHVAFSEAFRMVRERPSGSREYPIFVVAAQKP